MFEIFVLVDKKKSVVSKAVAILLFLLMLLGLYLGTVISPYVFEIPAITCGIGWYWLTFRSGVEYEYLYFEGDLKFTKIKDKRKRKRKLQLNMDKMIVMAPKGSSYVAEYEKNSEVYKRDFTSGNREADVYELVFHDEEGTVLVAFEPDEKMLEAMLTRYPRVIHKTSSH